MNGLRRVPSAIACMIVAAAVVSRGGVLERSIRNAPLAKSGTTSAAGACDVNGVRVSYLTSWSADAPAGYRVDTARVLDVEPTCAGAVVTVQLTRDGTDIGRGGSSVAEGATAVDVPMTDRPLVELVDGVAVQIAGGTVPIPDQCSGMRFDVRAVGTTDHDTVELGNARDLYYGLIGNDDIRAGNDRDCIDGGDGDDRVFGENREDALLGSAGNDELDGGNHSDRLFGGEGDDILHGGLHNDHLDGGPGSDTCIGGNGNDTFANCEVTSP